MPVRLPTVPRWLDGRIPYPNGGAGGAMGAHDLSAEIQAGARSTTGLALQVSMGARKQGGISELRVVQQNSIGNCRLN